MGYINPQHINFHLQCYSLEPNNLYLSFYQRQNCRETIPFIRKLLFVKDIFKAKEHLTRKSFAKKNFKLDSWSPGAGFFPIGIINWLRLKRRRDSDFKKINLTIFLSNFFLVRYIPVPIFNNLGMVKIYNFREGVN